MKNRQFLTFKFHSSRLKEFEYDIKLTFNEAKNNNEVIALFENQMIRSINDIHNRKINHIELEDLHSRRDFLRKQEHSDENSKQIESIQNKINRILYIPEYITIVMDHPSHYRHLYKNKLRLNGKNYIRFNSSASQARVSTVMFCEEETAKKLQIIMDNGRDLNKELTPSKLNAYKGLAGSSTQVVSTPRFCLVPDYESKSEVKASVVTETGWHEDDTIEEQVITESFERFDGQGLISYEQANKWADELGLDYVPAQWCIRQNYTKGMLNTFDIHKFCEEINHGNYKIKTSYGEIVDLRDVDVILTESQMKLWDSFPSIEVFQENCKKNNLQWGVSIYTPKQDKEILTMNYQFLQTLNLNQNDVEQVADKFVEWVSGISTGNIYYTILFLLGRNITLDRVDDYLEHGENNWIKALILNPELISDKFIKRKVHDLVTRRIQKACMGDIIVDGNFQVLVSDPYAMMQYVCGLEVTGLLGKNEYYSNYWNQKGVKLVNSMRSPLTYRSEHVLLNLQDTEELNKWYRHSYTGIIVNVHGSETMRWAGSDWDYDIIATTSDPTVIKGVYKDELPVVYEPPSSKNKILTEDDLFNADLFSFGSIIGSITNKSTSGYALLANLTEGSKEYEVTLNRIKMCTKLQSAQIDKAKIGREVKGIPSPWIRYQKVEEGDKHAEEKEFNNRILLDKHPYFFIYSYSGTRREYNYHVKKYNITCQQMFGITLDELKKKKRKTKEQLDFLHSFEKFSPVIESDSVMNNLSRYIESVDFNIKKIVRRNEETDFKKLFSKNFEGINEEKYKKIVKVYNEHRSIVGQYVSLSGRQNSTKFDEEKYQEVLGNYEKFELEMNKVCSNVQELVDHLVYMFYVDDQKNNKNILWVLYGEQVVENIKSNIHSYKVPVKSDDGELKYLNERYTIERVFV